MLRSISGCVATLAVGFASAATFTVTNLDDSGPGSLRDAVAQANANAGADTVDFAVAGTILLTSGAVGISAGPLTITGPGPAHLAIDGNANSRIFTISEDAPAACPDPSGPPFEVTMSGMTLRNGARNTDNTGGAIFSYKTLTLANMVVRDSKARSGGGLSFQVQYPGQALTIVDSQFIDNVAEPRSATTATSNLGGAVFIGETCGAAVEPVTIAISRTLFLGNVVKPVDLNGRAGAVWINARSDVTIGDSRFAGNRVDYPVVPIARSYTGGALYGRGRSITIARSEFSGNFADTGSAMGFFNDTGAYQAPADAVDVQIVNSTISGNIAGQSVTIFGFGNIAFEIANSTVAGNSAASTRTTGLGFNTGPTLPPSGSNATPPSLRLVSSILWNPGDAFLDIAKNNTNIPGPVTYDADQSIIGSICAVCGGISLSGAGNQIGVDPLLGPLAGNGGTTLTHALQLGSPAIGTGSNPLALATDQRGAGFARTQGAVTDIGAYEYAYPADCAGFTDVGGASAFCSNVAWLKNRAITLGCTSTTVYCPNDVVIRLAMAAFMKRLGAALSPLALAAEQASGALDLSAAPVVCATGDLAPSAAPRRLVLDGIFNGLASTDSFARMTFMVSKDGGITWVALGSHRALATLRAGSWRLMRSPWYYDLAANQTARFGLRMDRGSLVDPSATTDSTCRLRARVDPSNGFSLF